MQSLENVVKLVILDLSTPCQNLQRLCACYIQGTHFLIKRLLSCTPDDTIQDMFCLLLVLISPAVPSSNTCFHQPGNTPIATAEFLMSFSIKWQAKIIPVSLYQGSLVNSFWKQKSYRCAW